MSKQVGWTAAAAVAIAATVGVASYQSKAPPAEAARAGVHAHASAHDGTHSAGGAASAARAIAAGPCAELEEQFQGFFVTNSAVGPASCFLPGSAGAGAPTAKQRDAEAGELRAKAAHLRFVIATVPDPVHTHFSLGFDRIAEALQRAAQDEGYLYDSSTLPWEGKDPTYTRLEDQDAAEQRKKLSEEQPGMLLFRGPLGQSGEATAEPYRDGLVLLLVAEEPTGGLHRTQFENAVAWIDALQPRAVGAEGGAAVRIVGPTFSGSLPSLAELLSEPAVARVLAPTASHPSLNIYSGSVTSSRGVRWLQARTQESPLNGLHVHFASFQQSDELEEDRYCRYLASSGSEVGRLAILSEDETAFGSETATLKKEAGQVAAQNGAREAPGEPATGCEAPPGHDQPTYLYYPRDISALRAAYQRQSIFSRAAPASATASVSRTLEADLADPDTAQHDAIRTYSGDQTALSQEAELQQMTGVLRAHRSEYLLIRSSNPLDELFLAHYFKMSYPEGRVVIAGADLLLRRETGASGLNGIMTLSTYPLLPWTPDWTGLFFFIVMDSNVFYTNDGAEGAYIAERLLLHPIEPPLELVPFVPRLCDAGLDLRDYALPFWSANAAERSCHAPPTWLAVLGNGGFWPVAALSAPLGGWPAEQSRTAAETLRLRLARTVASVSNEVTLLWRPGSPANVADGDAERWVDMPLSMKLCLTAILCWAGLHLAWCYRPSVTVKPGHRAYFTRGAGHAQPRLVLFGSVLVTLAATVATWGFGGMSAEGEPLPHAWAYRAFLPVIWLLGALAVLVNVWVEGYLPRLPPRLRRYVLRGSLLAWSRCGLPRRHRSRARCGRRLRREMLGRLLWYIAITFGLFVALDCSLDAMLGRANRVPTYWRAMNVTTGISPLLPLLMLCAGLYGWLWYALQAVALFGRNRPLLPAAEELVLCSPDGHKDHLLAMLSEECAAKPIEDLCEPLTGRLVQVGGTIFAVVLAVGGVLSSDLPIRSLGSTAYVVLCCTWMAASISILLANAWQLMQVWLKLRHLLFFLDKLPLRRTLMALKGFSWGSVWKMSGNVLDVREKLMFRQFESLTHLAASLPAWASAEESRRWADAIAATRATRIAYVRWYAQSWSDWSARERTRLSRVQRQLGTVAAMLLTEMLIPAWREEKHSLVLQFGEQGAESGESGGGEAAGGAGRLSLPLQNAEELVCLVYMGFIQNVLGRMRSLAVGMAFLFVAIALSVSSYPFDPRSVLSGAIIVLFAAVGGVVVVVYAQMHRDATLSYLTDTKPGELGSEFWFKLVGFGVGPVFGLLASVFPDFTTFFFSWFQTGGSSIK